MATMAKSQDKFIQFYNNAKSKINSSYNKTKTKVKNFKLSLDDAYNYGYKSGWRDANHIKSDFFSIRSATNGYGKGLRNYHRTVKYKRSADK